MVRMTRQQQDQEPDQAGHRQLVVEEPADDLLALATSLDGEFTIDRPAFAGLFAVRGRRYDAHAGSWLELRCLFGGGPAFGGGRH